jgi:hypothetical protein
MPLSVGTAIGQSATGQAMASSGLGAAGDQSSVLETGDAAGSEGAASGSAPAAVSSASAISDSSITALADVLGAGLDAAAATGDEGQQGEPSAAIKPSAAQADTRAEARTQAVIEAQVEETAHDLPAPYYVRNASAFSNEPGQSSPKDSSSGHGYRSFDFGGGAGGSLHLLSSIKLAGASFASALANTPLADSLPAETANQIVQSLKLQWARGGGEAEIRLEPHHLGELKIALKVEDGRVNARLEAEAPVVREWLQTNQSLLKQSLAEQHLTLEGLEVVEPKETRDADRRERESAREGQPRGRQGRRRRAEGGELFEVVA